MKQYCRYCAHLVTGNGIYCTCKNKEMAESTAKATNRCKEFEYNEIDAFFETDGYKPRKAKETVINTEQMQLDKRSDTE